MTLWTLPHPSFHWADALTHLKFSKLTAPADGEPSGFIRPSDPGIPPGRRKDQGQGLDRRAVSQALSHSAEARPLWGRTR